MKQTLHRGAAPVFNPDCARLQGARLRSGLVQGGAGRDNHVRSGLPRNATEQGEPFRRDLEVRQNVLDRRELRLGQKERARPPVQQRLVK